MGSINLNPKHCESRLVVTGSQESFMFLLGVRPGRYVSLAFLWAGGLMILY